MFSGAAWHIEFSPYLPLWALITIAVTAIGFTALLLWNRQRGAWLRALALALVIAALTNPALIGEERDPLKSVVALIKDQSASQSLQNRTAQTDATIESLQASLAAIPNLETRIIETDGINATNEGTHLFDKLADGLSDIPQGQIAGAILITDGIVEDAPKTTKELGFNAPVHTLLTGEENEFDQRIIVTRTPRFGIVGEEKEIAFRIETSDAVRTGSLVTVTARINGEEVARENVPIEEEIALFITLDRAGKNILELEVETAEGELTPINNKAVQTVEGIRQNLRVLLVSGAPHPGERTWRNLLKSDASIDLVHFTILRPPEKQDGTPVNQLSLIAFPTRELFSVKINEFDLIIFDRYKQRGVLPTLYFDNIAQYVEQGGAILIAAGPDYAEQGSIFHTPLAPVLPALPIGSIHEAPFHTKPTQTGNKHPITRGLDGASSTPPTWSRWFRSVDVENTRGHTLMTGDENRETLIVSREGEGRVAMLLSDHIWLWSRGFEGGGPHTQLLRRLSHWLMKEPDLEEEALRATANGTTLQIERQTLANTVSPIEIVNPQGDTTTITLENQENGRWQGNQTNSVLGLHTIKSGELTTLAHIGPANPKEYQDVISTTRKLQPIADASKGVIRRISASNTIPRFQAQKGSTQNTPMSGQNWLGLKMTDATELKGITRLPLFAGFLGLALLLASLSTMWLREGR